MSAITWSSDSLFQTSTTTSVMLLFLFGLNLGDAKWNLFMNQTETWRILGVPGELFYVRNGVLNDYALTFNLPLKSNVTDIFFNWNTSSSAENVSPPTMMEYKMSLTVSSPKAVSTPAVSVPPVGIVPTHTTSFTVSVPCSGLLSTDVDIRLSINVTWSSNTTSLEIRRRKPCLLGKRQEFGTDRSGFEEIPNKLVEFPGWPMSTSEGYDSKSTSVTWYIVLGCLAVVAAVVSCIALACRRRRNHTRLIIRSRDREFTYLWGRWRDRKAKSDLSGIEKSGCIGNQPGSRCKHSSSDGGTYQLPVCACSEKSHCQTANLSCVPIAYSNVRIASGHDRLPPIPPWVGNGGSIILSSAVYPLSASVSFRASTNHVIAPTGPIEMASSSFSSSSSSDTVNDATRRTSEDLNITRNQISIRDLIINGSHGLLYYASSSAEDAGSVHAGLLIKTVTDKATSADIESMLQDACILRGVRHENVKPLLTVCFEPHLLPLLVYRFDNDCFLKIYLQLCNKSQSSLTHPQQLYMAVQVVSGLQYLHQRQIVHGDVAARNCLVTDGLQIKLSDAALAWTLFPHDYDDVVVDTITPSYELSGPNKTPNGTPTATCAASDVIAKHVPVRWCSIERLNNLRLEKAKSSDMWAMGVTIWEMLTYCSTPYFEFDNVHTLKTYVNAGHRLQLPANCSEQLYGLMQQCWEEKPECRITSDELLAQLQHLYNFCNCQFV